MRIHEFSIEKILTRSSGYLSTVTSHSLQPYRGCSYGRSLCGVGCYVQHNRWLTRGEPWGSFLEVRKNAAESYRAHQERESAWARTKHGGFSIFMSSATDPFVPQERVYGITQAVLNAMLEHPPDELVLQTHSDRVTDAIDTLVTLSERCRLRVHLSIESDRDRLPGLPPPASSVDARFGAAGALRSAGIRTVITVSPLLPISEPERFFARIADCADAVVIDHFIGGDGSRSGERTRRTALPQAMEAAESGSTDLAYRDRMVGIARRSLPGRVGVSMDGFAGRYLRD